MERRKSVRARVLWTLRRTYQTAEKEKDARLSAVGLRAAHYSVLINVAESPGLSGAVLARTLSVTPQNIASLAAKLDQMGLLERRPRSADVVATSPTRLLKLTHWEIRRMSQETLGRITELVRARSAPGSADD